MSPVFVPAGDLDVPAGFSKTGDTLHESVDDLIYDLKLLKPQKGGSLDQRIRFIDVQIEADRKDRFCSVF